MKKKLPPHHQASHLLRDLAERWEATAWTPRSTSLLLVCLAPERPRRAVVDWLLAGLRYAVHGSPRPAGVNWLDEWLASTSPATVIEVMRTAAEALDFPPPSASSPTTPEEAAWLLLDNLPHRFNGERPFTREEWEWLLLEAGATAALLRALGREVVRLPPPEGPVRELSAWVMEWAMRQVVALVGPLFGHKPGR